MALRHRATVFATAFIVLRSLDKANREPYKSTLSPLTGSSDAGGATNSSVGIPRCQEFSYRPLRNDGKAATEGEIRLLELLPAESEDSSRPVECRLKIVGINDEHKYEALSYCWGEDKSQVADIICHGKPLTVRKNLEQALRHLRNRKEPRLLWADGICINQGDTKEKNEQVQRMRTIYSNSQGTLIWLGHPRDEYDTRPTAVVALGLRIGLRALTTVFNTEFCPKIHCVDPRTGINLQLSPFSGPLYLELISILQRPWFNRAWVVQEVALSRKATLIWDGREYDWDRFVAAVKEMPTAYFPLAFMPTLQHIAAINDEQDRHRNNSSTLLGALLRHQRTEASLKVDKIFAFTGLVENDDSQPVVKADYKDDKEETTALLYLTVARAIIGKYGNLDLLSHPPHKDYHECSYLPSWAPDWSLRTSAAMGHTWSYGPLSLAGTELRRNQAEAPRFLAAGKTRHTMDKHEEVLPGHLVVSGQILDTVVAKGPVFNGTSLPRAAETFMDFSRVWMDTLRSFHEGRQVLASWRALAADSCPSLTMTTTTSTRTTMVYTPTGEPLEEAFWQTVSAGEYRTVNAVHQACQLWQRALRGHGGLSAFAAAHDIDALGAAYGVYILLRNLTLRKPSLEFELQGRYTLYRCLIRTSRGFIGLASQWVQEGDAVVLCKGSTVPLLLRKDEGQGGLGGSWRLVGDTYIHGVMYGECFAEEKCCRMVLK